MNILITGATSPLGSYIAKQLSKRGHTLFLHGRNEGKLEKTRDELGLSQAVLLPCDYLISEEFERFEKSLSRSTNNLDVLINCAFGQLETTIEETSLEDNTSFFNVSLAGTYEMIKRCIPLLRVNETSRIINIVADWGVPMHNVMTGPAIYIAGKYGVHGLGVALQSEIGKYGVRVTSLCPGVIAAEASADMSDEDFSKKYGNEAIHPRDITNCIEFVINQNFSVIKSITLSPTNPDYNGL